MPHAPGHVFDPYNLSPEEEKSRRLLRQAEDALAPAAMRGQLGERGPLQEFLIEQADEIKNITGATRARITDPDAFTSFLAGESDLFEQTTGQSSPMRQALSLENQKLLDTQRSQTPPDILAELQTRGAKRVEVGQAETQQGFIDHELFETALVQSGVPQSEAHQQATAAFGGGVDLQGQRDFADFEAITGRPSPMRQAMAAEEGRGIGQAQSEARSNLLGFPNTISKIGGGQFSRIADFLAPQFTGDPNSRFAPDSFREAVTRETQFGGGGNFVERVLGNIEQQIVGPGQALEETYGDFADIPLPIPKPGSFNTRTVVGPDGQVFKQGPDGSVVTDEFAGISRALVAEAGGDILNVLPVVGFGGDIARLTRATTGAVKRIPGATGRYAADVGQTGVGNVLLPPPRVQQAARAADAGGGAVRFVDDITEGAQVNPQTGRLIIDNVEVELNPIAGDSFRARELAARGESVEGRVDVTFLSSLEPGEGAGTRVLRRLTQSADEQGITLEVVAQPIPGGLVVPPARLRGFYEQAGFVFDDAANPQAGVRAPRAADDVTGGGKLFHGTRQTDPSRFVDDQGNLVLRSGENFGGQTEGVSFTRDRTTAQDYATRSGRGERGGGAVAGRRQNAGFIIEIDEDAVPNRLFDEAADEIATRGSEPVVIPAGRFRIVPVDEGAQSTLQAFEATGRQQVRELSNRELGHATLRAEITNETAEFSVGGEFDGFFQQGRRLTDDQSAIGERFGFDAVDNPTAPFQREEIIRRLSGKSAAEQNQILDEMAQGLNDLSPREQNFPAFPQDIRTVFREIGNVPPATPPVRAAADVTGGAPARGNTDAEFEEIAQLGKRVRITEGHNPQFPPKTDQDYAGFEIGKEFTVERRNGRILSGIDDQRRDVAVDTRHQFVEPVDPPAPATPAVRAADEAVPPVARAAAPPPPVEPPPGQVPPAAAPPPPTGERITAELTDFDTTFDTMFHPTGGTTVGGVAGGVVRSLPGGRLIAGTAQTAGGGGARATAETVGKVPVAGKVVGRLNPAGAASRKSKQAAVAYGAQIDEGKQIVNNAFAYVEEIGTRDGLFGGIDSTGNFTSGTFAGRSLNEVAENPTLLRQATPDQQEYIRRLKQISTEAREIMVRSGRKIGELEETDKLLFADRRIYARIDSKTNDILEAVPVPTAGPRGPGGRVASEFARNVETAEDLRKQGFILLPFDETVRQKALAAQRIKAQVGLKQFIVDNFETIKPRRGTFIDDNDPGRIQGALFNDVGFKGPEARQSAIDLNDAFNQAAGGDVLQAINTVNAIQRMFVLAGDASLFPIQLILIPYRHPIALFKSGRAFARQLVTATFTPKAAKRWRAKYLTDNKDLTDEMRNLVLYGRQEGTEALEVGGFLTPQQLGRQQGLVRQTVTRIKKIATAPLRPFQVAFETAMDVAGINMAKGLRHLAVRADGTIDPQLIRVIEDYVNNFRGITSSRRIGLSPAEAQQEAAWLLAARYRRATFAAHASVLQGGLRGQLAREAYTAAATGLVFSYIGITIAKGIADGKTEEQIKFEVKQGLDPSSGRFMLWRIAGQLVGPGSKYISDIRLLGRIITNPDDFMDFDEFKENAGVKWVRYQLAAVPTQAINFLVANENPVGEPRSLSNPMDLTKAVVENTTTLWVQSALFDGGTPSERATRAVGDFFGMRAFPQGSLDILNDASFQDLNIPYELREPYLKGELRDSLEGTLSPIEERRLEQGDEFARYYSTVDGFDDKRLGQEEEALQMFLGTHPEGLRVDRLGFFDLYFSAQDEARIAKATFRETSGVEFEEQSPEEDDANKQALEQYYQLFDPGMGAVTLKGNFLSDEFSRLLKKLQRDWTASQKQYVLRNTNTRSHAPGVIDAIGGNTKKNINDSEAARDRHRSIPGQEVTPFKFDPVDFGLPPLEPVGVR